MDYCLLERFQGAWLGSILGEALANRQISSTRKRILNYQPVAWLQSRNQIVKFLLETELDDFQLKFLIMSSMPESVDRLALLLLPLMLFRDEPQIWLRDLIKPSNSSALNSAENFEDVLIWGYAIFLALKERLNFNNLIAQLSSGVGVKDNLLKKRLELVNRAVAKGMAVHEVEEVLKGRGNPGQVAIAMSLYCLAATPEDFVLTLDRERAIESIDLTTMALTGALGGAYHGISEIPKLWHIWGQNNRDYRQAQSAATELFNTWSGVYLPSIARLQTVPVNVTGTIQPRANLQIISQTKKRGSSR